MTRAPSGRRLAAVLFLDIVGSTQVAAELGDQRWRELLNRFRQIVRAELKRYKGHEEDTAGDGFFATFAQPAMAVRGAVAIVGAVQEIGFDVRCGVHFGECETIEGQLGGLAVHIGARVMSLGGAATVLVTTTVRDLMTGTIAEYEDAGTHELKGVPGSWQVWRLTKLDGTPLPQPLDAENAREIRDAQHPAADRRRRILTIGASAVVALAAMSVLAGYMTGNLFAAPSVNLVRIDPMKNEIAAQVADGISGEHLPNALWMVNGALWQGVNKGYEGFVRRDVQTGAILQKVELHQEPNALAFGFGSIWLAGLHGPGSIDRWDAVSGRSLATFEVPTDISSMDAGTTALWVLGFDGSLFKVDPLANSVVKSYVTGAKKPGVVVSLGSSVWVCDCDYHRIIEFNPQTDAVTRTLTFPQAGFLVGLQDTGGATTLWLFDGQAETLTPIDDKTGQLGDSIGVGRNLHGATVAFGALWITAGDRVLRVDGKGPAIAATITMPKGFSAGSMAADPVTKSLWVADCGCPIQ